MFRYYHITKQEYLSFILKDGLKPETGNPGFTFLADLLDNKSRGKNQPVYLTDDYQFIIDTQLTENWIKNHKAILLEVFLKKQPLPKITDHRGYMEIIPHEFFTFEIILPENIKVSNAKIIKMRTHR